MLVSCWSFERSDWTSVHATAYNLLHELGMLLVGPLMLDLYNATCTVISLLVKRCSDRQVSCKAHEYPLYHMAQASEVRFFTGTTTTIET
jgi:hypothetical protein